MKRNCLFILIIIITLSLLASCTTAAKTGSNPVVGVFMSCTKDSRWNTDAIEIEQILLSEGYDVEIFYADRDCKLQAQQIEEMLVYNPTAMIINPVDPLCLIDVCETAKENGAIIIAYDKLLRETDAVDYFACFDNYLIGVQQGLSLVEGLRSSGEPPYNIEIFAGSKLYETSVLYYEGAMSIIQPLITSGEIIVPSGEINLEEIKESQKNAGDEALRLNNLITDYYSDGTKLHGIISPNDKIAQQLINTIEVQLNPLDEYPIITGQNAELTSIKSILDSKQYSTIFKDEKLLAQVACSMVIALSDGEEPEINDAATFDNGVKTVPAYLCEPILITKENIENILIETGYYKYEEVFED